MRTIKNTGCRFRIEVGSLKQRIHSKPLLRSKEDIQEWKYFENEYNVPDSVSNVQFVLNILSPGTFWIDDVRMEKLNNN